MFGLIAQRCFHVCKTTMAASKTSVLAKLRKSTGYSVANCKKALDLFPGDIKKAEEWLHAEAKSKGWAKWAKVQNRTAAQGLIGVCSQNDVGVMVEVNCETDFVSRNSEFQEIVGKMLSGCINFATNLRTENEVTKAVLEESELSTIKCEASTLGELLIAATCKFNEKTVVKRAVFLKVKDGIFLHSLSHPAVLYPNLNGASFGRYGALLAIKRNQFDTTEQSSSTGAEICQHIIGMNPSSIGQLTDKDIAKFNQQSSSPEDIESNEKIHAEQKSLTENAEDSDETSSEDQEAVDTKLKDSDETRLLFQPYLLDSNVTVGETLYKSGVDVLAFERFECGETIEELPEVAQSVGA